MNRGFSLIELVIVLTIISLLTIIAVPNFIDAQTRSDLSRVKSDLRMLATAIEAYQTDYSKPAPAACSGFVMGAFRAISDPENPGVLGAGCLNYSITTPVGYLKTFFILDPFTAGGGLMPIDERLYTYEPYHWLWPERASGGTISPVPDTSLFPYDEHLSGTEFKAEYDGWRLISIGPDRSYTQYSGGVSHVGRLYDPTNGLKSSGNIIRSEKQPEQQTWNVAKSS